MTEDPGMFKAIIDYSQNNPSDPLGLLEKEWRCMVCGGRRLYAQIDVAHVPPKPEYRDLNTTWNVAYCNDRPACTEAATTAAYWPPAAAGELCIPALELHATPHRGCVLR